MDPCCSIPSCGPATPATICRHSKRMRSFRPHIPAASCRSPPLCGQLPGHSTAVRIGDCFVTVSAAILTVSLPASPEHTSHSRGVCGRSEQQSEIDDDDASTLYLPPRAEPPHCASVKRAGDVGCGPDKTGVWREQAPRSSAKKYLDISEETSDQRPAQPWPMATPEPACSPIPYAVRMYLGIW